MKLEQPDSVNYCATVVKVKKLVPLEGLDNLVALPLFGYQALVSKDTSVGTYGIVFPAECQLSEEFTRLNNLYRHTEQNEDKTSRGYLEDNRRIRAIRLKGHRSDMLFMSLGSLNALGIKYDNLHEGDQFDKLDGHDICKKYVIRRKSPRDARPGLKKQEPRINKAMFPEMFDQMHWQRIDRNVPANAFVVITQKLHGTSIRVGHVPVRRRLTLRDRIAKKLGVKVQEQEHDHVFGSRKVIKDANNPNQQHFYDTDLWTAEGKRLIGLVPKNYIVYAEIIGWTEGGAPIQKNYTYNCLPGTRKMFVYRVAHINPDGHVADLSWDALKQFCQTVGLEHVAELFRGSKGTLDIIGLNKFLDVDFVQQGYAHAVPLAAESPCDEGICIRLEGIIPEIYKAKSPVFLGHETALLDAEEVDIEAEQESSEILP